MKKKNFRGNIVDIRGTPKVNHSVRNRNRFLIGRCHIRINFILSKHLDYSMKYHCCDCGSNRKPNIHSSRNDKTPSRAEFERKEEKINNRFECIWVYFADGICKLFYVISNELICILQTIFTDFVYTVVSHVLQGWKCGPIVKQTKLNKTKKKEKEKQIRIIASSHFQWDSFFFSTHYRV